MVLSPEHGMDRIAGKISTLGKIWEEKYFCLCYAGFKSRTGRESDAEMHHRPQLLIRTGVLTAWYAGVYDPGLEDEIYKTTRPEITGNSQEKLCKRIIKDYTIAA